MGTTPPPSSSLPPDPVVESRLRGIGKLAFNQQMVHRMNLNYVRDPELMTVAFPGGADLRHFPPSLVIDADNDRLRASGTAFARELADAGVQVEHRVVPGSLHGFLNSPKRPAFSTATDEIRRWLDSIAARNDHSEPRTAADRDRAEGA